MGSIYKRGNIYWIKFVKDGQTFYETSKSRKKSVASQLLSRRETEVLDGKVPGSVYEKTRFSDLEQLFLTDLRINGKRVSDGEKRLKHLRPVFGKTKACDIRANKLKAYIEKRLGQGAKPATINRELSAILRMLNLGYQSDLVARVPSIKRLPENNIRVGFLEDFEFEALREALPEHLRGLLEFGYLTGWRVSEVVDLEWDRVNLEERTVRLSAGSTKNKEARLLFMEQALLDVMADQYEQKVDDCPRVFHREGERIDDFRGAWSKACREAGIGYGYRISIAYAKKWAAEGLKPGPLYHDLRRTAVRALEAAGVPRGAAMARTGHKTESTYRRYNIINDENLRDAATRLEAHRQKGKEAQAQEELTREQRALLWGFLLAAGSKVTKPVTIG